MSLKSNLETLKDHLDLRCEYEPNTLPNTNVGAAEGHGKNYIKVKPPLVCHLVRNYLLIVLE